MHSVFEPSDGIELKYERELSYIENLVKRGSLPWTERLNAALDYLGSPESQFPVVHVAGTNGKGSTVAMLTSILKKAGYKTGRFIKPALSGFRDFIQLDDANIELPRLTQTMAKVRRANQDRGFGLTQFESIICIAALVFASETVDVAVIETIMGGRLDVTRIFEPIVTVFTSISLDHQQVLGNTVLEIAEEKFAITQPGVPTVLTSQQEEIISLFEETIHAKRCPSVVTSRAYTVRLEESSLERLAFKVLELPEYGVIEVSLKGYHQVQNTLGVLATVEFLKQQGFTLPVHAVLKGLRGTKWPGRIEVVNHNPTIILDGAHNEDGHRVLAQNLTEWFPNRKIIFVIGMNWYRDQNILEPLLPLSKRVYACEQPSTVPGKLAIHERDLKKATILRDFLQSRDVAAIACLSFEEALSKALLDASASDDVICVTGSLFLIGFARQWFS